MVVARIHSLFRWPVVIVALFTVSCLEKRAEKTTQLSTATWFSGVSAAKNLGGYPAAIKVSWNASTQPATAYRIFSLQYDSATRNNVWTEIDEVASDVTSYIHSDLVSGQIYSYMVRAVDANGEEDGNNKQVSTVAFDGIATARATGKTTATITLNTATGAFDEVRVYATPKRPGATKMLVATATGTVDTIDVTGLKSGVNYKFSAAAYMNYLAAEDGNEVYVEAQTNSTSFGSGATTDNSFAYRGVMSVQAFGDAPNAPTSPTSRLVRLTWPPFSGATSSTKYRVIRASSSYPIDATTATTCASTTQSSCIVPCTNVGAGVQTCEDTAVAAPPMTYNYVITLIGKDPSSLEEWVEELPRTNASDFYVRVPIPSSYMVLIQRDAANYEMCSLIGTTTNPRKNQRCAYSGIAATPYNSGPGKSALSFDVGYYDFGYNLFVDRFKLACNWTRTSAACGPDGCIGVNGTSGPPSAGLGNVGDVYFTLNPNYGYNCYLKKGSGWTSVDQLTDPAEIRSATTIDPGANGSKHRPSLVGMGLPQAFKLCNAQTTDYGQKRLMRRREYVHAANTAALPGEPGAVSDPIENSKLRLGDYSASLNVGGQLPGYYRCAGSGESLRLTIPTTVSQVLSPTNTRSQIVNATPPNYNVMSDPYFIGTTSTSNCVTRWGSQDMINNQAAAGSILLSDTFIRTNALTSFPAQLSPVTSDVDSGVFADWGSYAFNGTVGPAIGDAIVTGENFKELIFNTNTPSTYARFIPTLGVALITNSSAYPTMSDVIFGGALGSNPFNSQRNASHYMISNTTSTTYYMMGGSSHRFSVLLHYNQSWTRMGTWCAVEAE